jgi:prepilin-type N-terminal cleavage/methylation domain-containing protein
VIRYARRHAQGQGGYSLIEVVIASAIGAMLMTGLTSVILTSVRATSTASSRIEASSQIRSFEFFAYDDFARSGAPVACPAQPPAVCLTLLGFKAGGSPTPTAQPYQVTYIWDGSSFLDRQVGSGTPQHVASNVTGFSWYVGGASPKQTCAITLTVTIGPSGYAESQTLLFYPQLQ